MSILVGSGWKPLIILKKQVFMGDQEYHIRREGLLEAGCDGTRSGPLALHFIPRCLESALLRNPKFRFGPEKLINYTLFAAGGNNTLELMSN